MLRVNGRHLRSLHRVNIQRSLTSNAKVWVLSDGGIESSLRAMALGRSLAGNDSLSLKTVVASKGLQTLPPILQKYVVEWTTSKSAQPWYLDAPYNDTLQDSLPDYLVCSGANTVSACLHAKKLDKSKKMFSVFAGYPNLPFINFDQVVLPRYEANFKLGILSARRTKAWNSLFGIAKLGPLAKQKNCIITNRPLLGTGIHKAMLSDALQTFMNSSTNLTAVVVGGHSPQCRWYSEDAALLADTMRRMVNYLNTRIIVVFTDRTPPLVKKTIQEGVKAIDDYVYVWDAMEPDVATAERLDIYESVVQNAKRVILTADLDYATAHAASWRKPVYVAFGGRCRSYLQHFHQWARESRLTRKLRLDRTPRLQAGIDPYSYLGKHMPWNDGWRALDVDSTMTHVKNEIEAMRYEKVTGKRRKDEQSEAVKSKR
ncbi:hypothetical protein EC973_005797 [Apophysomyces ossiformis]|uniref:Mitochondrial fission protein ELM1 n=1 Tax=Apophysomyces ossiformis TaxID=679940 RepID=A0A8H7BFT4_9FUNG|nr:hypothetical protein EC973_005797 [Apophysomyces ossiformis]